MGKSLYSVILSDEVVREIDRLSLAENTNRSNLINQILAEYVSYTTPEMRINNIFSSVEQLMKARSGTIIAYTAPHQSTMSLKSSLEYRYRPTVKYEVELYKGAESSNIGRLTVTFRTQSQALLYEIERFFRLWCSSEAAVFGARQYVYSQGRFIRSIELSRPRTPEETAGAISAYIQLLDDAIKGYLSGRYGEADILIKLKAHAVKEILI